MLKLYYLPGACSLADHIVLEWTGLPYTSTPIARDALQSPEFLTLSPNGQVPVLEDDGWVLTENLAIMHYLADLAPDAGLHGDGTPRGHAEVLRWLAFINSDVHPSYWPLFGPGRFLADPAGHDDLMAHARRKLRRLYTTLDRQLAGKQWLTGSRSLADPYLFVTLRWAAAKQVDLDGLDNLAAFSQRMLADPAVQAALKAEGL